MSDVRALVESQFLEMRWRCLSLAADLDRIERAVGGQNALATSPQLIKLLEALVLLQTPGSNRAERVQLLFSDLTPPPR